MTDTDGSSMGLYQCPERCEEVATWQPLVDHMKETHGWVESDIELLTLEKDEYRVADAYLQKKKIREMFDIDFE